MKSKFLIVFLIFLCALTVAGQSKKFSYGVKLVVTSSNEAAADRFYNRMAVELRNIENVKVTKENADFIIRVSVNDLEANDKKIGYIASVMFTKVIKCGTGKSQIDLEDFEGNTTLVVPFGETDRISKNIISLFDSEFLNKIRRVDKHIEESIKKLPNS